ncbi:hypothetical protein RHMOL_Rhmol10G0050500 [Rhododendron molle]|uniref:Uncharacterized protein n=1 Tax=Rhododendron molle TaxID=49168 RepID=A0ACC0M036_RHOML|nr:hypothetical protein RHMOL_Rhmol10G0050500 [Rhododendron molle]
MRKRPPLRDESNSSYRGPEARKTTLFETNDVESIPIQMGSDHHGMGTEQAYYCCSSSFCRVGTLFRTSESISQEDPKAMMGRQYKELCRFSTQLATRAAETEEAYKIALDGLNELLEEVDVRLRRHTIEEPLAKEQNKSSTLDTAGIGKRARGIEVKERTQVKIGKRLTSALERATKRKKSLGRLLSDDLDFMREPVLQSELHLSPPPFLV